VKSESVFKPFFGLGCGLIGGLFVMLTGCASGPERSATALHGESRRIALQIVEPAWRDAKLQQVPVSVGLVFPKGELGASPSGTLVDDRGRQIECEIEVTGWWDAKHQSIKWLLLHFPADTDRQYWFLPGSEGVARSRAPLANTTDDLITVNTGAMSLSIARAEPTLLDSISVDGESFSISRREQHELIVDDGKAKSSTRLVDWSAQLDQVSDQRASVTAQGYFETQSGERVARLDLRYQFFKGESHFRLYHTVTWMVEDPQVGVAGMSMQLPIALDSAHTTHVGINEKGDDAFDSSAAVLTVYQDSAEHFAIESDGKASHEGKQLGGWIAVLDENGSGVSLSLRHAWQTYPTQFRSDNGQLSIDFWPSRHARMGFTPREIMGDRIYFHPTWNRFPFVENKGHFVNNYEKTKGFEYTAEGAAWTHELTIGFHSPKHKRSPGEINSVTQYPVALRQDPASAMRVPFMGMNIPPYDAQANPQIEKAIDWLGRLSLGRWISENNYGLLRFGMVRWSKHGEYTYYRWMDNTQYDQQMIPWLLFMRGGDRRFFDDGEITGRYCMDMNVNHYNTRDSPTGYMATCGGSLPFPNFAFTPWNLKGMKLHFLAYYWHLTGYPRAKEVMDKVIAGAKEFAMKQLTEKGPHALVGGREMYNMNRFWATAYQETHDPDIAQLAAHSRYVTVNREYDEQANTWGPPKVYLYNGLLMQDDVVGDSTVSSVMRQNLQRAMLSRPGGGITDPSDVIATDWAYQKTGEKHFAHIGYDVARGLAELAPTEIELDQQNVPYYPYAYVGNSIIRMHVLPMLVGLRAGQRAGLSNHEPRAMTDLCMWLDKPAKKDQPWSMDAYVKRSDGHPIPMTVFIRGRGDKPVRFFATEQGGSLITDQQLAMDVSRLVRWQLPSGPAGSVCRLRFERDAAAVVMVDIAAPLVYHVPSDQMHASESLSGGQSYTPTKMYTRVTVGPVGYFNRVQRPYAIHRADTGELILRGTTFTRDESSSDLFGTTPVVFTTRGSRSPGEWQLQGVEPYVSPTMQQWFDPTQE